MMVLLKKVLAFMFVMSFLGISLAEFYWVGGDVSGWSSTTGDEHDYGTWASRRDFHIGDILAFYYVPGDHNVKQVTHQEFQSCNITSPIVTFTSGYDRFNLKRIGHYYFVCDFPGHCQAGHKVDILVTPASLPRASPPRAAAPSLPSATPSAATPNSLPSAAPRATAPNSFPSAAAPSLPSATQSATAPNSLSSAVAPSASFSTATAPSPNHLVRNSATFFYSSKILMALTAFAFFIMIYI